MQDLAEAQQRIAANEAVPVCVGVSVCVYVAEGGKEGRNERGEE